MEKNIIASEAMAGGMDISTPPCQVLMYGQLQFGNFRFRSTYEYRKARIVVLNTCVELVGQYELRPLWMNGGRMPFDALSPIIDVCDLINALFSR